VRVHWHPHDPESDEARVHRALLFGALIAVLASFIGALLSF